MVVSMTCVESHESIQYTSLPEAESIFFLSYLGMMFVWAIGLSHVDWYLVFDL